MRAVLEDRCEASVAPTKVTGAPTNTIFESPGQSAPESSTIKSLGWKELKSTRRKHEENRTFADMVVDFSVLCVVRADPVTARAAVCLDVLRRRMGLRGMMCQCPLHAFMKLGLSLADADIRRFVPLQTAISAHTSDASVDAVFGHREEVEGQLIGGRDAGRP